MDDNALPNDVTECHRLLLAAFKQSVQHERQVAEAKRDASRAEQHAAQSEQQTAELNRVLDETAASYQELQQEHAAALDELAWYKRWTFGRRRERLTEGEGQRHLFELDPPVADDGESAPHQETETEVKGHRRRKKRQIDWDKLHQVRHDHDLKPEEKMCSCCGREMDCIGEDVTRELEYQRPKLEAHIHVRPKYACRRCKHGVSAAPLPPRPIPGGIAGPGLITEVYIGKFGDHLPLYRLEDILTRYGVFLSRSTLCDWMKAVAHLFRPLYELQRERVLQSSVMWTDDTRVTVLGGPEGSFKGYFWTYLGDQQNPYSVYDFTNCRSREGPRRFLESHSGYLQPMRIPATTQCFWTSDRVSLKLPVGRTRGVDSSMLLRTIRVQRIKFWSGFGNSMTSKTGRMTCRLMLAASFALLKRSLCSTRWKRTWPSWLRVRCRRAPWAKP